MTREVWAGNNGGGPHVCWSGEELRRTRLKQRGFFDGATHAELDLDKSMERSADLSRRSPAFVIVRLGNTVGSAGLRTAVPPGPVPG